MDYRNYLAEPEDEQLASMMSRGYGAYSPPPVNAMTGIGMGLARTAAPGIFRAEEIAGAPLQQRRAMAAGEGMGLGGPLAFTGIPQAAKSLAKKITVRDHWGNKVSVNLKQIGDEYEIPYNDFMKILNDTHGLSLKGQIGKGEEFDFGKLPWQGGPVKVPAEYVMPGPPKAAVESFEAAKKVPMQTDVYSTEGKLTGGGLPYIAESKKKYK